MVIVPQQRNILLQLALTLLLLLPLQISSFTLRIPSQHPPSSITLKLTLQQPQPQRHNSVKRNKIVLKSTLEIEPSEINNLSNETTIISTNIDSTAATTTNDDIFVVTNDDKDASTSTSTITDKKKEKLPYLLILWRFTRPHTLIGSAIAIPSIHLLSASSISTIFSTQFVYSILYALIPSLLMNVYITGLNQLTDVNIDKINKPTLPLASGDLSMMEGVIIVLSCLVVSLGMGLANPVFGSMGLNITLWGSAILGTLYSLPPFRLKRFPALAAFCIVAVRGMVINTGFYSHALSSTSKAFTTNSSIMACLKYHPKCLYSSLFFGIFGIVIALMKDVPDIKGDEIFGIKSLSVRLGPNIILKYMKGLLSLLFTSVSASFLYLSIMNNSSSLLIRCSRLVVSIISLCMGWSVRKNGLNVNGNDSQMVYKYYMHLWKLFYISYFALPFAR